MVEIVFEKWLSDSEIKNVSYSEYWNNEEEEKNKEWDVSDGNFSKMEEYLRKTGLPKDLENCVRILKTEFSKSLDGVGMDLACGNLWAARYLFSLGQVEKLYAVEYSKHRLTKIGPAVVEFYRIPRNKLKLIQGSFYDLHVGNGSIDFIFMSQAFHHAAHPKKLLKEISRVLKPGGVVIIIGEHLVDFRNEYMKHVAKFWLSMLLPRGIQLKLFGRVFDVKRMIPRASDFSLGDPILGDHYYTDREYKRMFSNHGFQVRQCKNLESQFQSFLLVDQRNSP